MFLLMTSCTTTSAGRVDGCLRFEPEVKGAYSTLEDAIAAAILADLDLEDAVIEKNGARHNVNGWIACRIAGGLCQAG